MPRLGVKVVFGEMGEKLLFRGVWVLSNARTPIGFEFQHIELRACLKDVCGIRRGQRIDLASTLR